jgi:hypothetical protein
MIKVNTIKEAVQTASVFLATALVVATLTSCEKNREPLLNTEYGSYNVESWVAIESKGYLGGYDFDTTIHDLCVLVFDYGTMYTAVDSVIQAVPTIGFLYENNFSFATTLEGNTMMIGGETWIVSQTPTGVQLTRTTNYGGMGSHIHKMNLKEI